MNFCIDPLRLISLCYIGCCLTPKSLIKTAVSLACISLLQLTCRPHLTRSLPLFQGLRQLVAINIRIQCAQCATSNPHNRSAKREQSDALVRVQQSKDRIRVVPILLEANLLQDVSIHHTQWNSGGNVRSTTNTQTQTPCSFLASTAVPENSSGCSAMADSAG